MYRHHDYKIGTNVYNYCRCNSIYRDNLHEIQTAIVPVYYTIVTIVVHVLYAVPYAMLDGVYRYNVVQCTCSDKDEENSHRATENKKGKDRRQIRTRQTTSLVADGKKIV
mgnify:FL=1